MRYITLDVKCVDDSTCRIKFNTEQISTWRDNEVAMANGVVYTVLQSELEITTYIKATSVMSTYSRNFKPREFKKENPNNA